MPRSSQSEDSQYFSASDSEMAHDGVPAPRRKLAPRTRQTGVNGRVTNMSSARRAEAGSRLHAQDTSWRALVAAMEAPDKPPSGVPSASEFRFDVTASGPHDTALHPQPSEDAAALLRSLRDAGMIPAVKGAVPPSFSASREAAGFGIESDHTDGYNSELLRTYNELKATEAREQFQKHRADKAEATLARIQGELEFHLRGVRDMEM
ncbi:MAG: hypothetical protein M1828_005256 [Chrysothrix sp. TS-e1954]|nr:MAG: hypothetical protein M1828_005256 [Chrysothrix sp. TS-e1954]